MRPKLSKNYVSEIDQFLCELDKKYPQKAEEWLQENRALQRIFELRDKSLKNSYNVHHRVNSTRGLT